MAKYGVFWGENDPRNVARKRGVSNKLIVYTDFNCPPEFQVKLASYAARDFHMIQGTKMKNAELLKELYEISKDVNVRFKSASYATVWSDKRHGADSMHRLAMFPVTLFRAQLAAIEEALKEAVDNRLPQVVVVTDSSSFLTTWRKKFVFSSLFFILQVCFRYEEPRKDSDVWSHALDRCLEAIDSPLMGKDRSEYGRSLADVVSDPSQLKDSGIQRVRIFKRGTTFASGYVWENVDDEQGRCGAEGGDKALQALVKVLEQVRFFSDTFSFYEASLWGLTHLIVRTDSSRLILAAENWLPIWHRNGWRNSLHKPIADCESWQRIWSLKKSIKV
ncbi:unnamed protein product [Nippostrongylus brasiliensis]|uniref:RNase H type-1 domain-containing protein n=1 Tax=Nippostrongylus brasiliensis TaxID=27835 RepID=A0A0N4XUI4_NIPBR|nr:unnamed protein product [Nippostrongylus brasiliensis]